MPFQSQRCPEQQPLRDRKVRQPVSLRPSGDLRSLGVGGADDPCLPGGRMRNLCWDDWAATPQTWKHTRPFSSSRHLFLHKVSALSFCWGFGFRTQSLVGFHPIPAFAFINGPAENGEPQRGIPSANRATGRRLRCVYSLDRYGSAIDSLPLW